MLVSFVLASKRPDALGELLANLQQTARDPASFEVLVKIDQGDTAMADLLQAEQARRPFVLRWIAAPRDDGYYGLHRFYDELSRQADPQSYFHCVINDEILFLSDAWDEQIARRVKLFPDDVFFLRISDNKWRNYYTPYDCCWAPENYGLYTRKWLEVVGGWGDFWGPDSWQQSIAYHLGRLPRADSPPDMLARGMARGHMRAIAVPEIQLGGGRPMERLTDAELRRRTARVLAAFERLSGHEAQENFCRLAQRLNAHLWAIGQGIPGFILNDDLPGRSVLVADGTGVVRRRFSYRLGRARVALHNLDRRLAALGARAGLRWARPRRAATAS